MVCKRPKRWLHNAETFPSLTHAVAVVSTFYDDQYSCENVFGTHEYAVVLHEVSDTCLNPHDATHLR
jgi:hypothetical protein